uniref:Neurotransmitter-gated ion-channel ligand-binding domain-containing protein n=1 Tax=Ditylenchus dipsaci TaxID=166011 RepID=A0A915EH17_9BILA
MSCFSNRFKLLLTASLCVLLEATHSSLMNKLFSNYDKKIRPYADNKTAVHVQMTIVLGILIEMKENEQVASYVISHTQRWLDPNLSWRPEDFSNIKELIVPHTMLWLPKLFVYNSMSTKEMLSDDKYDVRIQHNGQIKINIPQYVKCICRLSIEQFPFDTQFCAVALASPLLTIQEMDVESHPPPKDSYFAGNAEWKLINVTVRHLNFLEEGEYRSEVHYIFHLRRRPVFYITVIVVPIFLISTLSILGIFTPGSNEGPRSEKVSLAGAMPKSNSIPLLGYYILSVIILCAVAACGKARIPSNFTYRLMFIRPSLFAAVKCFSNSAIHIGMKNGVIKHKSLMSRDSQMYTKPSLDDDDFLSFQQKDKDSPKKGASLPATILNGRPAMATVKPNTQRCSVDSDSPSPKPKDFNIHLTKSYHF